jgi:enoyl-CoA hydratase/3-hydroxyacyl-CoA dehydrogenase
MSSIDMIRKVAVIGAGTMGHGIAEVAALAGYEVWMYDIAEDILKSAMEKIEWSVNKLASKGAVREDVKTVVSRIHPSLDFEEVVKGADFVIEAVPEKIDLKRDIFAKLDKLTPPHAILATNTSSLPITEIAAATDRRDKVVGMHFFNPPPLMPLVEIIRGEETSDLTVRLTVELGKKFGKQPVIVNKDVPGFIVNRLLMRFMQAACWMVANKKATVIEVDSAVKYKLGFPMGAFELADYSGIDIMYLVGKAIMERGTLIHPCPVYEDKYKAGEYGVKTGKGFYEYPAPGKYSRPNIPKDAGEKVDELELIAPAINEAAWLLREGIATRDDIDKATELGLGYPKGLFKYADDYGVDKVVETLERMHKETGWEEYEPDPLLTKMVEEGKLGRKTGEGFYVYPKIEEKRLENIIVRLEPPIAWIVLNRPRKLNALTVNLLKELSDSLDELEEKDDIRVVVITGSGRAFSAGADVTQFMGVTPFKAAIFSRRFQEITNKIEYYTKPVIMMINGFCLGGGMEIALSGDFRFASELAMLGQPEINLGIIPGAGATQRMPRIVGISKAKELIYSGEMIPASEALKIGLVDRVFPPEKLEDETRKFALKLSEKPPLALLAAKYAIQLGMETDIWHGLNIEAPFFGLTFSTEDVIEGVTAFMEKRKPKFKGK